MPAISTFYPSAAFPLRSFEEDASSTGKRTRAQMQVHNLRPAVLLDESLDPELQGGELFESLVQKAKECDLLLIAGASLVTESIHHLVRDIAAVVHNADGAVVLIDTIAGKKNRFQQYVDFHLQMDVQSCSEAIMQVMDKVRCANLCSYVQH